MRLRSSASGVPLLRLLGQVSGVADLDLHIAKPSSPVDWINIASHPLSDRQQCSNLPHATGTNSPCACDDGVCRSLAVSPAGAGSDVEIVTDGITHARMVAPRTHVNHRVV